MNNRYEGQTCPVCHSYLFEDDDVVVCPICGAPHHRSCYAAVGHCALEVDHGTERQYDPAAAKKDVKSETRTCAGCGREMPEDSVFCPFCGHSQDGDAGKTAQTPPFGMGYIPFMPDPYGGVDKNADIGGVTAEEARRFIAVNTSSYIPKFSRLSSAHRSSWNWAAFLLPHGWLLYRKQYKLGIFATVLTLITAAFSIPLSISVNEIAATLPVDSGTMEIANAVLMKGVDQWQILAALGGILIMLLIRVFFAVFGDYLYKNHVIEKVKSFKDAPGEDRLYVQKGGVNPWLLLLSILITSYLPLFITDLFI